MDISRSWTRQGERGASLIEALIAAAIVITITTGVAHLLVWSRRAAWTAGADAAAVSLAVQKMEQLRSLTWYVGADGLPVSDESTNLAHDPPSSDGAGLRLSPVGTLDRNTPGFVDYVDAQGRWCGTGLRPPEQAAFVRRWAIGPFPADGPDTLALTVLVQSVADAVSASPGVRGARLHTLKTRVRR